MGQHEATVCRGRNRFLMASPERGPYSSQSRVAAPAEFKYNQQVLIVDVGSHGIHWTECHKVYFIRFTYAGLIQAWENDKNEFDEFRREEDTSEGRKQHPRKRSELSMYIYNYSGPSSSHTASKSLCNS